MKTSLPIRICLCALALTWVTGCSGSPTTSTTAQPGGGSGTSAADTTTDDGDDDAPAGPGIGEPCAADGRCGDRLTCVSYYGIAGAQGPEFKSCEARCDRGQPCPDGTACTTIADGPGRVCR